MAIKVNFIGIACYDLIQYVSYAIHQMGNSVLLIDKSNDRSLESSILIPEVIKKEHTVDSFGVRFSRNYYVKYDEEYDFIFFNWGTNSAKKMDANLNFIICNSEEQSINQAKVALSAYLPKDIKETVTSPVNEKPMIFDKNAPVFIYMDITLLKNDYIKFALGDFPCKTNYRAVELTYRDYELKLQSQTEQVTQLNKLSLAYRELIRDCCLSILNIEDNKEFENKYKQIERGN